MSDQGKVKTAVKLPFKAGDFVVYPTHGVGKVKGIETQEIAGHKLKLIVISFEQERMTLRLPVSKAETSGLRPVASKAQMELALKKLKGRARTKKAMWSRRAQEYESKINSGDPASIAEVLRDLHLTRADKQLSYGERRVFETARQLLVQELAVAEGASETDVGARVDALLS